MLCRTLRLQRLEDGVTGVVEFNEVGDRINPVYNVLNKQYRGLEQVGLYGANEVSVGRCAWGSRSNWGGEPGGRGPDLGGEPGIQARQWR